jgi:hypothetical protein
MLLSGAISKTLAQSRRRRASRDPYESPPAIDTAFTLSGEILDLFVHLEAYAGAARAFDSYQIGLAVFAEQARPG